MVKVWKVIVVMALTLIVLGVACAAVGIFTGASVDRMIDVYFGGRESLQMMLQVLQEELLPK